MNPTMIVLALGTFLSITLAGGVITWRTPKAWRPVAAFMIVVLIVATALFVIAVPALATWLTELVARIVGSAA